MPHVPPPVILTAIYGKDIAGLARFYEQVLGLAQVEQGPGFIALAGASYELVMIQARPENEASLEAATPIAREETPLKLSFLVPSIEAARLPIEAAGGNLKPAEAAWSWRGQVHLDGVDPDGNVFQLREIGSPECDSPRD